MIPDWIITGIQSLQELALWWTTGMLGALVYWLPVLILLINYTKKNIEDIKDDKEEVEAFKLLVRKHNEVGDDTTSMPRYYRNNTTIGTILGRYAVCFIPLVNLFLAIFDALGDLVEELLDWLKKVFNIKIIENPNEK